MVFTAYHDVSFDFLLPILIDRQHKTIAYLQRCADQLNLAPMAKALVEETVGMAKGHLEALEELTRPAVAPAIAVVSANGDEAAADPHVPAPAHH
jgi:hypothetical protein